MLDFLIIKELIDCCLLRIGNISIEQRRLYEIQQRHSRDIVEIYQYNDVKKTSFQSRNPPWSKIFRPHCKTFETSGSFSFMCRNVKKNISQEYFFMILVKNCQYYNQDKTPFQNTRYMVAYFCALHANMQHNYFSIRLIYFNKQHDYVDTQFYLVACSHYYLTF